jgi:integration host factor subunit beta
MTKADLIDEVSSALKLTTKESDVIVQSIFGRMVKALRRGEKIEIRGFGSFHTRQRRPRTGRNPKTGQRVAVPAKTIPYFKPSKEVRALINSSAVSSKEPALA